MKLILHSVVLALSFFAIFLQQQFADDYTIHILALLVIVYFVFTFLRRTNAKTSQRNKIPETISTSLDIFIVNAILMLLILQTGGLYSPIFFLVYFLCFGITFIFEPFTVFVFSLGVVSIFLPEVWVNHAITEFVKIGSLLVITPFAFFFGKEYKTKELLQQKAKDTQKQAQEVSKEVKDVIESEKHISPETKSKLSDILKKIKKI